MQTRIRDGGSRGARPLRETGLAAACAVVLFLLALASRDARAQCAADVNADGAVDSSDFFAWVTGFTFLDPVSDVNADGVVSDSDFFAWVTRFGQPCPAVIATAFWQGGDSNGPPFTFRRSVVARQPDGTDVGAGEPRFGEPVLRVPAPTITETFRSVTRSAVHIGAGYASDGTLIQFNVLREIAFNVTCVQATHGEPVRGDPLEPPPANARRYNWQTRANNNPANLLDGVADGDVFTVNAGAYFQDAWVTAHTVRRESPDVSGVAIAVGNYTRNGGLSGSGGIGDTLDIVFTDILARTDDRQRLREWSVLVFVIDDNEIVFNVVDYSGQSDNDSWAIMIRATRPFKGGPWVYGPPCVVFAKTDGNIVDHFHQMATAVQSEAGTTPGAVTQIASSGDVIDDQAVYVRTIHDLSAYADLTKTYRYTGQVLELAFAEAPEPGSFFGRLTARSEVSGTSSWGPERNIYGRRNDDVPGEVSDWGAPQFVGCAPGPKRSQVLFGADRTRGQGIVCYDVDTFDPETESPAPRLWQRWGNTSQFGFFLDDADDGLMNFRLHTPTPEAPEWYVGDLSQTNQDGERTLGTIMLGRVTDDGRVVFGKLAQDVPLQSYAMTRDGQTIYAGGSPGAVQLRLQRPATVVRPMLVGAGFDQYQPLFAAGDSILPPAERAGKDQLLNRLTFDLAQLEGVGSGFATDDQIEALEDAGLPLPGLGPVYAVDYQAGSPSQIYLRSLFRETLPIRATFSRKNERSVLSAFPVVDGNAELLVAVALDPAMSPPRNIPLRLSFGSGSDPNPLRPGYDYGIVPLEAGGWHVLRLPWRDDFIGAASLLVAVADNVDLGQVPVRFYLQVIGLSIGPIEAYPMGYHAAPYTVSSTPGTTLISGSQPTPNEEVTIPTGLAATGTIAAHLVTDPHGVDREYYLHLQDRGEAVDHSFFSFVQDFDNSVEFAWRNGDQLIVRTDANGVVAEQVLPTVSALQRQDDFKIVMRYSPAGGSVDVWHNGNRLGPVELPSGLVFANPVVRIGDPVNASTIPVMLMSVGGTTAVLDDPDLIHGLRTGRLLEPPAP